MLHFDLRTPDSAYDFILRMCKMTGQEFIEDFHVNCSVHYTPRTACLCQGFRQ